jgi:site-specific recombinase XerD
VAKACKTQKERQTFLGAIPPDCRPYDCRHSFGTEALRLTGDLHTVGALLQHSAHSTAITQRYTLGAQSALLSAAVAKLSEHWGKPTPPPAASPMAPRLVRGGKT